MTPDFLRAFLRAGMFVALASLLLVVVAQPNTAEYVIAVCSLLIGLTLVGLVVLVTRLGKR